MDVGNSLQMTLNGPGRNIAPLAIGLLALAVASPAAANPTDCFDRTFVGVGKVNDTANGSTEFPGTFGAPNVQPETGNQLYRIDQFDYVFDEGDCDADGDDVNGLSVVLKNPFDIPGPDDLSLSTFLDLRDQMETDFPDFDHWTGWAQPDPDVFDLSTAGFHGVSVCIFTGGDVGNASNLDDCVAGTADRLILSDINGQGMIFSIDLFDIEEELEVCGECDGDEFELAVVVYTDLFHNTSETYSHPEAMIGYQFEHVPEPALLALLAPAAAGLAWRRRARR